MVPKELRRFGNKIMVINKASYITVNIILVLHGCIAFVVMLLDNLGFLSRRYFLSGFKGGKGADGTLMRLGLMPEAGAGSLRA